MSLSSMLCDLEELTLNAEQIQDDLLEEILKASANTEYLHPFLNGSSDKELFKKNVPVVNYEDVRPYIERVANGEPSNVISGETITSFLMSSGTTGGKHKIFPVSNKYFENFAFVFALRSTIMSKHIDGIENGKKMTFLNARPLSTTPSGMPLGPAVTSVARSDYFKNRSTSPDEVIYCSESKQSMYCHLLCGLVQREEVVSMVASFASMLVQAINFLETHWKELCNNIRSGYVSEWITDLACRESVSALLGGPNSELADLLEHECSQKTWEGMITRLWPNIKFIQTVVTGQMSQYIPILEFFSNKLPLISPTYAASETVFGVNVEPLCNPQDVSYTFIPNMSYFEFVPVDEEANNGEVVDLVNVKIGCFYETLVTNRFGLYRYRMGDILQVTGFYNSAPQFRFVRRKNTVLSIQVEATTEEDLIKAINQGTLVLESSGLMSMGFTWCSDISTVPGHYVLYWELKAKDCNDIVELDNKIMVECCCQMEESFDVLYKKYIALGLIGALEIRVVQQGGFDALMEYFISQGASSTQYKAPICINSPEGLAVLEDKVLARFFSKRPPPL